jgi:hypothetical protein
VSEPTTSGLNLRWPRVVLGSLVLLAVCSAIAACNASDTSPEATDPPSTVLAPTFGSASATPEAATPSVSAATPDTPSPSATSAVSDAQGPATTPLPPQSTHSPSLRETLGAANRPADRHPRDVTEPVSRQWKDMEAVSGRDQVQLPRDLTSEAPQPFRERRVTRAGAGPWAPRQSSAAASSLSSKITFPDERVKGTKIGEGVDAGIDDVGSGDASGNTLVKSHLASGDARRQRLGIPPL